MFNSISDYSLDEGTVNGSTNVMFNQPVPFYVENYLGFPVGTPVPVGKFSVFSFHLI